ncbi:nucleotidyl transferase AbiEii/AbiGii toxin family protein [Actinopolymorpha singaporensis]
MSTRPDLTPLQLAAARLFFELPESQGFVVAGGAALIASGLITRATNDIDLFAVHRNASSIPDAASSFEIAAHSRGWTTRRIVDQHEFVRLLITNEDENLVIDLGRDSPPDQPTHHTVLGPTLAERDLAARKTLALYGRAEGRDFADVYHLAHRFGRDNLIAWAHHQDSGFDTHIFATMLNSLNRLNDRDIPIRPADIAELRTFFAEWWSTLTAR